jgi:eukaryotic-like serine/threonine-protein kinase
VNDRYSLLQPLAAGGMAELFLGVSRSAEQIERKVAIKRVLPHLARDPTIAQMFLAEARLAMSLQHQNIVTLYDVGQSASGLFLVMELVEGWDLGMLLRHAQHQGQRFPPHLVAFIATQVLAGLAYAYRRQVNGRQVLTAHRDVSPSNVLISGEGEVKVSDFGIARVEGLSMGTAPGTFKGKFPYASPETLRGKPATAASDQFALGIVLYELLAGHHPFGEDASDPISYAHSIPNEEPPPLQGVPTLLSSVVMKALAKEPSQRFARPEDMAQALAVYLSHAGEPANSQALAAFIASLQPPPTLVERAEMAARSESLEADFNAPTRVRQTLPTRPLEPASFELAVESEWQELPGGSALSASGELVQHAAPASPQEQPTDLALPAEEAAPPPRQAPPPSAFQPPHFHEQPLELAERAPQVAEQPAPEFQAWQGRTTHERKRLKRLLRLAVVLVLAGAGVVSLPRWLPRLSALLGAPALSARPTLTITSSPSGATVSVGGEVLGTTPLAMDNTFPSGPMSVQLTLRGYRPWKATFQGGEPVVLEAQLRPSR